MLCTCRRVIGSPDAMLVAMLRATSKTGGSDGGGSKRTGAELSIWSLLTKPSSFAGLHQAKGLLPSFFVRTWIAATPARRHSRSEEHTSELQSLMRISYADF